MNAWKPILAALVIFAAGVMTGGLTVKLRRSGPDAPPRQSFDNRTRPSPLLRADSQIQDLSRRMERRLNLTPVQRERIAAIVRESQARMKTVWEDVAPRTREEFRQLREKIRAELTPGQRQEFEELFRQRDESRRRSAPYPSEEP